jgi:hypothetical protein
MAVAVAMEELAVAAVLAKASAVVQAWLPRRRCRCEAIRRHRDQISCRETPGMKAGLEVLAIDEPAVKKSVAVMGIRLKELVGEGVRSLLRLFMKEFGVLRIGLRMIVLMVLVEL